MKAAVLDRANEPLVVRDVPVPDVGPRDVRIQVRACGVCHTDLHFVEGLFQAFGVPLPPILGHEVVGLVEDVGSDVTHLTPGDRVGVSYFLGCGYCRYCFEGEEELCLNKRAAGMQDAAGGYAEYIVVPAANALPLPPELDFVDAAPLFCAGITVYAALKNAGLRSTQRVAVLGIGGLGHLGIAIARAMGAEVIALTSTVEKVDLAREMGAHQVIAGGEMGQQLLATGGADVILSTTIDTATILDAFQGLAPGGTLALTGVTVDPLPIIPALLVTQQQRIIGSLVGSRSDMRELLRLVVLNDIRPRTETFGMDEINTVFDRMRVNEIRFRGVLILE